MELEKLLGDTIAHAYIFAKSDSASVISFLENKCALKFGTSQNAILYDVESFGIEDSRAVTELGNLQADGNTFVAIIARNLTAEAQHALLKTFEEPRPGVHFFLFVENPEMLLPTLRSRSIVSQSGIGVAENGKTKSKTTHPHFLEISLAERFAYIEKLAKGKKEDPNVFKYIALEIFDTVITQLKVKLPNVSSDERERLERVLALRAFLNDRGSSPKQLLETMSMQL